MNQVRSFIAVVAATATRLGIGKDGSLPWRLVGDMAYFKQVTTATFSSEKSNAVIMGRRTWQSIPEKFRPLPGRRNVVLSRNPRLREELALPGDVLVAESLDEALAMLAARPLNDEVEKVFVIGGGTVYEEAVHNAHCQAVLLTEVSGDRFEDCDTFFPEIGPEYTRISTSDTVREGDVEYTFNVFKRCAAGGGATVAGSSAVPRPVLAGMDAEGVAAAGNAIAAKAAKDAAAKGGSGGTTAAVEVSGSAAGKSREAAVAAAAAPAQVAAVTSVTAIRGGTAAAGGDKENSGLTTPGKPSAADKGSGSPWVSKRQFGGTAVQSAVTGATTAPPSPEEAAAAADGAASPAAATGHLCAAVEGGPSGAGSPSGSTNNVSGTDSGADSGAGGGGEEAWEGREDGEEENCEEMQYLDAVRDIIKNGVRRGDRTGTGTLSKFGMQMRFSLRGGRFPLLTTKRVFWRGVVEELLWFVSGCTDATKLSDRGVHIWDDNGSRAFLDNLGFTDREEGDLGPVYGFQWRHFGAEYRGKDADYAGKGIDQLAQCIHQIKTRPEDRRIILSAWNPADLGEMALPPCHVMCQFHVAGGELSCQMYQRSADMGLGVPFNIASYALLTRMVAHVCGLEPGDFVHTIGDAHVYVNHVDALRQQLQRAPRRFPTLALAAGTRDIDAFKFEDFALAGYAPHATIKMKMAV